MNQATASTPEKFFGFKIITETHLSQLQEDHYSGQHQLFQEKFTKQLNKFAPEKQIVFLEFLSNVLTFCVKSKMTPLKISTLLEISAHVFAMSFSENMSHSTSYALFEKELVRHCLHRPPVNVFVFTKNDLSAITWHSLNNLYRHYSTYENLLSEAIDIQLNNQHFHTVLEPQLSSFEQTEAVDQQDQKVLREYIIDKETGLTQQELEEIMKGDSIHQVPKKKREEWIRLKKQREVEEKIQKAMEKELAKLNAVMEQEIKKQDQEFLTSLQALKDTKKKK